MQILLMQAWLLFRGKFVLVSTYLQQWGCTDPGRPWIQNSARYQKDPKKGGMFTRIIETSESKNLIDDIRWYTKRINADLRGTPQL